MSVNWSSGHQGQHVVLKAFALLTQCAIGLFEPTSDGEVKEILPLEGFESYCRKVQSFSRGKHLCHKDHVNRAKQVIENGTGELTLCYAGVLNQSLPIVVDGKVRAVLMYGQMWVEGDGRRAEARKRHERTIKQLRSTEDDELELRVHYDEIKRLSRDKLHMLNQQLSLLQRLFYEKLSEEQARSRQAEGVIHELQARLQPALAEAENLYYALCRASAECRPVKPFLPTANKLLNDILAMRTLVRNLGAFMPEYQLKPCWLETLVEQAVALYEPEAEQKQVAVLTDLERSPKKIEVSRMHLQEAINNLLQNAIKYSFRGAHDRYRYVEIQGKTDEPDYMLTFSNYGVGILQEELDLIFQAGYKGQLTRKEYRSGAGMGLAIAKEVIEKHHGTIKAQSAAKGGGAYVNRFVVRLPLKQPEGGEGHENRLD
jgi:signal transduction histidine kinase